MRYLKYTGRKIKASIQVMKSQNSSEKFRTGQDQSGWVRTGHDKSRQFWKLLDRLGDVNIGQDRTGKERRGQDGSENIRSCQDI